MADIISDALDLASSDPMLAGVVFLAGFLVAHLLHAIRYASIKFGPMQKLTAFVKYLLFLKVM
jgi:hypothetical protein